ncbi:hypothetical protein ACOSQ2_019506 [Xanthoceras sorbifolium]
MHTLKVYVRNKAHPEGSIAEGYTNHECLNFCSMYFRGIETRFNRPKQNYDGDQTNQMKHLSVFKPTVRLLGAAIHDELTLSDWAKIRWYVLNNCDEVYRYIMEHRVELERDGVRDIEKKQEMEFYIWFSKRVSQLQKEGSVGVTEDLKNLSNGLEKLVTRYTGYRDYNRRTQNCGVLVKGEHRGKSIDFYGVLKDIIEVSYFGQNKVVIFKCDWWDLSGRRGIQIDEHNIISVNIRNIWYKNDPFVLACQTQQVFYLNDIKLGDDWRVVDKSQPRGNYDVQELEIEKEDENDMDLIDVDVNIEDQNDAIDNSMDDDNVTDDVSFNYEGNEEDCISFNDESDCEEDYISSNNESDDT